MSKFVWPFAAVSALLVVAVATMAVVFDSGSRRLGPAPLHADIAVSPFASIPVNGLTYPDIEAFLRPHVSRRLEPDGPLRFRVQPRVLRSAKSIAPILLQDGEISRAFEEIPAVAALRAADDLKGYARVSLLNDGSEPLTAVAIRLPGARAARITRTSRVPDEDAGSGATKQLVETTTVTAEKSVVRIGAIAGETEIQIEAWLDRVPTPTDWSWADKVRLTSSAGAGSYQVHQMVAPIIERFDRNPLIGAAAVSVLAVLVGALTIAFGAGLYWNFRNRKNLGNVAA